MGDHAAGPIGATVRGLGAAGPCGDIRTTPPGP